MRMEHISKRFGNFYANKDVNLTVRRGEVLTLLGENGAGKSTLMNILIGLYQPTEGKIFLHGKEARIESPGQAVKLGIGMVHQHFMLVEAATVFDNIILGDKHSKGIFINRAARRKEIMELSERYGLDIELDAKITEISVGAQQRVEILKALYHGAELLILDEPTAALTDIEVEGLFAIMNKLRSEGKSVIFISHKMREVLHISDRITILRAGEVITTVNCADTDGQQLANLMIGRELTKSQYEKKEVSGEPVVELKDVEFNKTNKHNGLAGVSMVILSREIESEPDLLVVVHPTRGLDIGATRFVHDQMIAARERGVGILLISADFDEVLEMSDRVLVIFEGQIMGEFSGKNPPIQEISLAMTGK